MNSWRMIPSRVGRKRSHGFACVRVRRSDARQCETPSGSDYPTARAMASLRFQRHRRAGRSPARIPPSASTTHRHRRRPVRRNAFPIARKGSRRLSRCWLPSHDFRRNAFGLRNARERSCFTRLPKPAGCVLLAARSVSALLSHRPDRRPRRRHFARHNSFAGRE